MLKMIYPIFLGITYINKMICFYGKNYYLLIICHGSIMNTRNNKNHSQIRRQPSDDYNHLSEPKAWRHHRPPSLEMDKTCCSR